MPTDQSNGSAIYYEVEGAADKPALMLSKSLGCTMHLWDGQRLVTHTAVVGDFPTWSTDE